MPTSDPIVTIYGQPAGTGVAPEPRPRVTVGTEGDDRLTLDGGSAQGNGGHDVFVLTSNGLHEASEKLGTILDYGDGDSLDLSHLGANAQILATDRLAAGGQRFSIDYDGDGHEDGYVLAYAATSDGATVHPADGEATIQPFPMPGDGEVTILPYPMPGDGQFTILPYPMPGDGGVVLSAPGDDEAVIQVTGGGSELDWMA